MTEPSTLTVTTPPVAPVTIAKRPTTMGERTLLTFGAGVWLLAVMFGLMLILPTWPASVSGERVLFLGFALLLSNVGLLVAIAIFISSNVGTVDVKASAGVGGLTAEAEIGRRDTDHP